MIVPNYSINRSRNSETPLVEQPDSQQTTAATEAAKKSETDQSQPTVDDVGKEVQGDKFTSQPSPSASLDKLTKPTTQQSSTPTPSTEQKAEDGKTPGANLN